MLIDFLILFFVIFTDLITKHITFTKIFINGVTQKELIPNFISLERATNQGAAFGSFQNNIFFIKILPVFIAIFLIVIYIILKFYMNKEKNKIEQQSIKYKIFATSTFNFAIIFLLGGSIGNLFDRFFIKEGVRDFIRYDFIESIIKKPFAIGNLADVYIIVGIVFMVIYLIKILIPNNKEVNGKKNNSR